MDINVDWVVPILRVSGFMVSFNYQRPT